VLPLGLETPGHFIFVVEANGERVGRLWLAERQLGGSRVLYVYDVSIDAEQQGRGYGRAAMRLAEDVELDAIDAKDAGSRAPAAPDRSRRRTRRGPAARPIAAPPARACRPARRWPRPRR
jgi:GNAT superfamily N-acetyltransferase